MLLDEETSASSLVKMIRQRMNQEQTIVEEPLEESRSMTLAIVSLENSEDQENPKTIEEQPEQNEIEQDEEEKRGCFKIFSWFKDRPLWRLFIIMTLNGLFSLAWSALIIRLEKPAQDQRLEKRQELLKRIENLEYNIKQELTNSDSDPEETLAMLKEFSSAVAETKKYPAELTWDLLNAQAFITSVQTTTGLINVLFYRLDTKVFF